jgi:hypothetical protein
LGEGSGKGEGRSYTWQTHALGSRTKEDRRGTTGQVGENEGGKEDGLIFIGRILDGKPRAKVLDGFWGPMEQMGAASARAYECGVTGDIYGSRNFRG